MVRLLHTCSTPSFDWAKMARSEESEARMEFVEVRTNGVSLDVVWKNHVPVSEDQLAEEEACSKSFLYGSQQQYRTPRELYPARDNVRTASTRVTDIGKRRCDLQCQFPARIPNGSMTMNMIQLQ